LTPIAGTATPTEDFDPDPITLFWGDGNHGAKTVAIAVVDDSVQEGPESFTVELSNPTGGAVIGEPSRMTITIEASDQGDTPSPPPPAPSPPAPPPTSPPAAPSPPPSPRSSGGGGGIGVLSLLLLGIAITVRCAGRPRRGTEAA
jgi:hypothetical protein